MRIYVETQTNVFDSYGVAKTLVKCNVNHDIRISSELDLDIKSLIEKCGRATKIVEDLLFLSAVIYTVDKLVSRSFSVDNWTRDFEINIRLQSSELYIQNKKVIEHMLSFLTGDSWLLNIEKLDGDLFDNRISQTRSLSNSLSAVSLFSGGLDSLIGCINWLEENPDKKIALVGHHDPKVPGPKGDQICLFEHLKDYYPDRLIDVFIMAGQHPSGRETTFRSRSVLFIALGIYVAQTTLNSTLIMPENGTIALNFPLTPSRKGSCSTRTAHPYYLGIFQHLLNCMGIKINIAIPYKFMTKGEFVISCKNRNALRDTALLTRSCAKSGHRKTWIRRTARNCGRCMPCIYRRAALNKIGLDTEEYGNDICFGEVNVDSYYRSVEDFRACLSFLNDSMDDESLAKTLYSNTPVELDELNNYINLVKRTKSELKEFLRAKANDTVKRRVLDL